MSADNASQGAFLQSGAQFADMACERGVRCPEGIALIFELEDFCEERAAALGVIGHISLAFQVAVLAHVDD